MQPVRAIIAAIFLVIGVLIMIPAFNGNDSSDASSTSEPSATPTATSTGSKTATSTKSASPSKPASPPASRTATPTPSKTPSKSPTATKPPAPTATTKAPAPAQTTSQPAVQPLTVAFGAIKCPSGRITVKVTNDTQVSQSYSIIRNKTLVLADRLGPDSSRTSTVTLAEDKTVTVRVTQNDKTQAVRSYRLNCAKGGAAPSKKPTGAERLPYTGTDETVLIARIATGAASILTGAIILWWGGLWPRRRDRMFGSADRG